MYDDMPAELKQALPHDVRQYVANFWSHPADPDRKYDFYDTEGEKFFYYLADERGPLMPEMWGDIVVLLFARGCLKTTTCTMIANWASDVYGPKSIEGLVTAPRRDQTQEVMLRFTRAAEESGLSQRRTTDKKEHQEFTHEFYNSEGELKKTYSDVKARSAWGEGDALRGIHAHYGIVDEFQDVDEGMFSVFLETIDRSVPDVPYFPVIFVIGTPKMASSFFHTLWDMSDQKRWDDVEKQWVDSKEPEEYLPEAAKERKRELQDKIDALDETEDADLIQKLKDKRDEISGFKVTGWHIDQHACPRHSEESIAFKKATYSKRKFKNEVEAEFYSPENDLLTDSHVKDAFIEGGWRARPIDPNHDTFIGVDWGGGDGEGAASTVVTIWEEMDDGTITVLNVDVLDSNLSKNEELEQIEQHLVNYDATIGVVDEGYGDTNRSNLQRGIGTEHGEYDNVYGCMYGNVGNKKGVTWNKSKDYFTVNRTFMIESMVEDFKRGNINIPADDLDFGNRRSLGTMLIDQLTAPYTDRVETSDGKKKLKVLSDRNDDIFHAFVYAWIAANHVRKKREVTRVSSHKRRGYE